MKDLLEARKALLAKELQYSKTILYGDAKAGKTALAGTAARLDQIDNIYWFDLENGVETLLNKQSNLTDDQLKKVKVFSVVDSPDLPVAGETILKAFTSRRPVSICYEHGKVGCAVCKPEDKLDWHLLGCTKRDLVVIDSGTQLGISVHKIAQKLNTFKDKRLYYVESGSMLNDIFTMTQAVHTNVVMITHALDITNDDGKLIKTVPLVLSQGYSKNVGKFFGQVAYLSVELRKFKAGSSSTYKQTVLTGSRTGAAIENITDRPPTMKDLLFPDDAA